MLGLARAVAVLCMLAIGCAGTREAVFRAADGRGSVRIGPGLSRKLELQEQGCRRDESGHLYVWAHFTNSAESGACTAKVRIKFFDAASMMERDSYATRVVRFPPGATTLSWTSRTSDAVGYAIEVFSSALVLW